MNSLFGLPIGAVMAVLVGVFLLGTSSLGVVALRNRTIFKMAVRNIPRRRAQTVLIVLGLMLATLLFSASFAVGDTLAHSIRVAALRQIGLVDEIVFSQDLDSTGRPAFFDAPVLDRVREALSGAPVDGLMPVGSIHVPVVAPSTQQSEANVGVQGFDPGAMEGFDLLATESGQQLFLEELMPGEVFLSAEGAENLKIGAGDAIALYFSEVPAQATVAGVFRTGGNASDESAVVMTLDQFHENVGKPGQFNRLYISNRGGIVSGERQTDAVVAALAEVLDELGLEVEEVKRENFKQADQVGGQFASIFLLFGNFSVIAGVLLIFLIFVMLAAERKQELGIARAIGGQRGHIVRLFAFEGAVYSLIAAAVGSVLGVAAGLVIVKVIAAALVTFDIEIVFSFRWQTVVIAYTLGMTITFIVVLVSSVHVSRLNIVRAVRDIPEPPSQPPMLRELFKEPFRRALTGLRLLARLRPEGLSMLILGTLRASWSLGMAAIGAGYGAIVLGAVLIALGLSSLQLGFFALGVSLVIIGVPLALRHGARLPGRAAYTIAGLLLVAFWLLPFRVLEAIEPEFQQGIEMFILSGVMLVIGAVWAIVYNADVIIWTIVRTFRGSRNLAPILRIAMAYPLAARLRTGMTLAMFSLVVFTLVVIAFIISAFVTAFEDTRRLSGGFDIQAQVSFTNPLPDMRAAIAEAGGLDPDDFLAIGALSGLPVKLREVGLPEAGEEASEADLVDWFVTGVDEEYLNAITYGFGLKDDRYETDAEVWQALLTEPDTVVVAPFIVPGRADFDLGETSDFEIATFYRDDETLPEVYLEVFDFSEQRMVRLRIIGVIEDSAFFINTVMTSHASLAALSADPLPTLRYMVEVREPSRSEELAEDLEGAFVTNGLRADSLAKEVRDATAVNLTFNRLIQGFMGLGLVVGIAALGVIAARAVVERRQQIGVLRALGYQRDMVQLSFLLESSFIALLGIAIGIGLGLGLSIGIIADISEDFEGVEWRVPWLSILVVVVIAYGASLLTTFLPARQAANVYPAEALRYE